MDNIALCQNRPSATLRFGALLFGAVAVASALLPLWQAAALIA